MPPVMPTKSRIDLNLLDPDRWAAMLELRQLISIAFIVFLSLFALEEVNEGYGSPRFCSPCQCICSQL